MIQHKFLNTVKLKGYQRNSKDVELRVIGLFDSLKVFWTYYAISTITGGNITNDLKDVGYETPINTLTIDSIKRYGIKFDSQDDAKKYILDFEMKWESGLNNTIQEIRDKKLKELTDEK